MYFLILIAILIFGFVLIFSKVFGGKKEIKLQIKLYKENDIEMYDI